MIYLDHNATTTVPPRVAAAMAEALGRTGNPSSIHAAGRAARKVLESAREAVATLLGGVDPAEIVFTSGGTEANTIAILGAARERAGRAGSPAPRAVHSAIEHPAVFAACERLAAEGFEVRAAPVDAAGVLDLAAFEELCAEGCVIAAVMSANNETGVRQPVEAAGRICRGRGVQLHVDAVQSAGRERIDVRAWGCGTAAISAHKFGGPQGAGALWISRDARLAGLSGAPGATTIRPGTPNLPGLAGLGEAARMVLENFEADVASLRALRDRLAAGLGERVQGVRFHTPLEERGIPNTLSVAFEGVPGQTLLMALDLEGVCVSAGPACKSGAVEPSHVLLAMGLPREQALETLRFSVGRANTPGEIDAAVAITATAVARIRN